MEPSLILLIATAYLGVLFAVAYYGDEQAELGRSIIANPYIYALSLAVYCTAWTFYGSVGRAATSGLGFLPIYLGPTLLALVWWIVLRKIVRISRYHRITSISDFIGSRYGKSARLASVVTVVAVMGIVPYIALQLKAISTSFDVLVAGGTVVEGAVAAGGRQPVDTAFWTSLFLAVFAILFGTPHLDVTERHEGLVAAIAFESVVKLVAFIAVGAFVTFGLYDGFGDLFAAGAAVPEIRSLYTTTGEHGSEWVWLTFLSMLAVLLLPRQFQVAVVENVDEDHVRKASWLFPLYLLAINLFVLPIAVGGLLEFGDATHADAFVLKLPLAAGNEALAVLAFVGGLSAATGMVIVATTALSTMICNDLVVPVLLRWRALRLAQRRRLTGLILGVRRGAIVAVLLLGYAYLRTVGDGYSLVSIGLISFAAVAQFAPAVIGGLYWRRATRKGALAGLVAGFCVWGYTLPLPSLVDAGYLPTSFVISGPFGIEALRPYALFGMESLSEVPHTLFWSLLVNAGLYAGVSLFTVPTVIERSQAALFVDVFRHAGAPDPTRRATAPVRDLRTLLQRFLGWRRTERALAEYARRHDLNPDAVAVADEDLVRYAESLLSGVIGAASARVVVGSVVQETPLHLREVMDILDETQQVLAYSRELERKRAELERTTRELQSANEKLQQLDRLKDDFVSTVTHELRTPLTSIRALTEILHANPDLDDASRQEFLQTIQRETERLTRLVNQVLDVQRLDAEPVDSEQPVDLDAVVRDALAAMEASMKRDGITVECILPGAPTVVCGDRDRLMQVVLNLLSNAAKYSDADDGRVQVHLRDTGEHLQVAVADNGPGVPADQQEIIFQKFRQAQTGTGPKGGSGLGLAIAQQIVHQHGGDLWVESDEGDGATFAFRLPKAATESGGEAPEPSSHSSPDAVSWRVGEGYKG